MKKVLLFVLLFLIVGGLAWGGYYYYSSNKTHSVVTIDINPSIELSLNENNKVLSALALNEDASILLSDLSLKGLTLEEATEIIVNEAIETGYIDELSDENDIYVTSYNEDEDDENEDQDQDEENELSDGVIEDINTLLDNRNIAATVSYLHVTDEVKTAADEYGISNGKMLLVEKLLVLNPDLDKATLVESNIQGIQKQIQEAVSNKNQNQEKEQLKVQKEAKVKATKEKVENHNKGKN